jgi:hypothetical protein
MKIKLLLAGLVIAGLVVSSAVAAPPAGKGKPETAGPGAAAGPPEGKGHKPDPTGPNCKPKITVVLKGSLVSASATSLSMNVTGANRWGRAYEDAGTAGVTLDPKTKVRGNGMKSVVDLLAELKAGDRVLVQARVCKADLKDANAKPPLTASKVIGHPAKAESNEEDDD